MWKELLKRGKSELRMMGERFIQRCPLTWILEKAIRQITGDKRNEDTGRNTGWGSLGQREFTSQPQQGSPETTVAITLKALPSFSAQPPVEFHFSGFPWLPPRLNASTVCIWGT